jgi:tRNA dimethylallyltransferase
MPAALAIVGCTASGKSALALALARARPGEIELVSADAMQVYRGMDIGTAKPTAAEQAEVPHHLIDVVEPWEDFSLARFVELGRAAIADIERRGKQAVIVGGTGLYVRGLVDDLEIPGQFPDARAELEAEPDTEALHRRLAELDPVAAARMEPNNRRRVLRALEVTVGAGRPFSSFGAGLGSYPPVPTRQVGLAVPFGVLDERIDARLDHMINNGFADEVRNLLEAPHPPSRTARQALGYRELLDYVAGRTTFGDAVVGIRQRTRQFARRQARWFRRDPRAEWLDGCRASDELVRLVAQQ